MIANNGIITQSCLLHKEKYMTRMLDPNRFGRFSIGFDRLWDDLGMLTARDDNTYPPYNIQKFDNDKFRITLAVAGFSQQELVITSQQNSLSVSGKREETTETTGEWLHRGIASRNFQLNWKLANYVEVEKASIENGLLHIDLVRQVPKEMLPRQIDIQ